MRRKPESEAIDEMAQARRYHAVMGRSFMQHEYRRIGRQVARMLPDGGRVLDIGTGPGYVALEVAARLGDRADVVGLDLSKAMLTIAAENARAAGLRDNVAWAFGDAASMPFADGTFDFVVSSGSLHHWRDPVSVFAEVARVLTPVGGYLISDLQRLKSPLPRACAWLIGMSIPPDFRKHFWSSIESAYTPNELAGMLDQSELGGWTIEREFVGLRIFRAPRQGPSRR
ncbi:MAG TPA: class I SAM-dependent methyltransferase [Armatimonadetes bacterium]|jgi:ubiquinone/menaquinone biosynthesis C-methylase UbiE|nr:class I SAM-dependent methyltransferase [Armatimonadota bacterium]